MGGRVWLLALGLLISGCGGGSGGSGDDFIDPPIQNDPSVSDDEVPRVDIRDVDQLYPYKPDSPYAEVLKECALAATTAAVCRLSTLPYIGQGNVAFTDEDILDRLLVTHEWMGQRFATLLDEAPADLTRLFGSLTSISIGSTVRPSFYRSQTGAIRLDPQVLWLSKAEKANVSTAEDPRADYGRDLQFFSPQAYRINGQPAYEFFSLTDTEERTLADITVPVYRLLFHELGHAVDYVPAASMAGLDSQLTPRDVAIALSEQRLSVRLYDDLPLYSRQLIDLAQVRYRGEQASETQKSLTAGDVGVEMVNDGAVKFYGYATVREDVATLLATAMIKKHFNVDISVGYVQKPDDPDSSRCADWIVGWGMRQRLANPLVLPRAKWVVDQIYGPSVENDLFFSTAAGAQSLMTPGVDWCTNRDTGVRSATSAKQEQRRLQFELADF